MPCSISSSGPAGRGRGQHPLSASTHLAAARRRGSITHPREAAPAGSSPPEGGRPAGAAEGRSARVAPPPGLPWSLRLGEDRVQLAPRLVEHFAGSRPLLVGAVAH